MARAACPCRDRCMLALRDLRSRKCILLLTSSRGGIEDQSGNISGHFAKEESFAVKF